MFAAIVFTKSRGGFLGLVAVLIVVAFYTVRVRPGVLAAAVCVGILALPSLPSSFWARMNSILVAREDPTGSREARVRLMTQAYHVFLNRPLTGVGAGQFKNYGGPEVTERWRETHDVWLQVAAEMGIAGLTTFLFLVFRAFGASLSTLKMLRPPRRRRSRAGPGPARSRSAPTLSLTDAERASVELNARAMLVALIGWSVCACFASVAYNWTFYYVFALAVAGREFVKTRRTAAEPVKAPIGDPRLVGVPA
jgi:O-antigen ligase